MLYLVWNDESPGNKEIYFRKSTNYGTNWINLKRLTWNTGWSNHPKLGIDSNGDIHVVYEDRTPGNQEIFYKRSTDGGLTWGAVVRITWDSCGNYNPIIAVDSINHLHVVWWKQLPAQEEIYYKRITDGGSTWTMPYRITWNSGCSWHPFVITDSNNTLHLVWADNTSGNFEIYYKNY